ISPFLSVHSVVNRLLSFHSVLCILYFALSSLLSTQYPALSTFFSLCVSVVKCFSFSLSTQHLALSTISSPPAQVEAAQQLSIQRDHNRTDRHQHRADGRVERDTDRREDTHRQRDRDHVIARRPDQVLDHL